MKRYGRLYEQLYDWHNLVHAEYVATKRKGNKGYVKTHVKRRISNLVEIQRSMIEGTMVTPEYQHDVRISGQNKVRDIAKLKFHPSHICHQSLTLAATGRVEKHLIPQTYASRIGFGQLACALKIKKNLRKYIGKEVRWFAQGDIIKYYEHIQHSLIREKLNRIFKDPRFIDAFMEPFERFSSTGVGIPLGIRPSQLVGNLVLSDFDHFMKEEVHAEDYVRYLDDFLFTGSTKGEVKWKMKRAVAYLEKMGFKLHVPKIGRVSDGIDTMGFVFYGTRKDMWWRKSNKVKWLCHRHRLTNKKRILELDNAAWGMLKWGNSNGRNLWKSKTGINKGISMSVKFVDSGIHVTEKCDKNGVPFIEETRIDMRIVKGNPIIVTRWVKGVKTSHGSDRYALSILFNGIPYKLIINSYALKNLLDDMERNHVTRFKTVFTELSPLKYNFKPEETEILEVDHERVVMRDGVVVSENTGKTIVFN